jgi:hypothetical protein
LMVVNKFGHRWMTNYEFNCHWCIEPIFGCHLEIVKWQSKYFLVVWWWPIFQRDFRVYEFFNATIEFNFYLWFCVFGCPLITIACGTLGELRLSSPWLRVTFFAFCKTNGTF